MISLQLGPRSDANGRFGVTAPQSLFDIERDAEIQEIHRSFKQLTQFTGEFQEKLQKRHQKQVSLLLRLLAGVTFVFVVSVGSLLWILLASTPQTSVPPATVAIPSRQATSPAKATNASSESIMPALTSSAASVAAAVPKPEPPQVEAAAVAAKTSQASGMQPLNLASPQVGVARAPVPSSTPALPVQTTINTATQVKSASGAKPAKAVPENTTPAVEEKVFSLEAPQPVTPVAAAQPRAAIASTPEVLKSDQGARDSGRESGRAPAKRTQTTSTPTSNQAVATSLRRTDGANPKDSAKSSNVAPAARREKYGSAGVITLTPSGVVVFDRERGAQRMIPVGGQLPDGSTLKGIDVKGSRISTDDGDVIFD